jgi:hypothetical protein
MRTCFALLCALALFASPFFFAYLEAERLLVCWNTVGQPVEPFLRVAVIAATALLPLALQWAVSILGRDGNRPSGPRC